MTLLLCVLAGLALFGIGLFFKSGQRQEAAEGNKSMAASVGRVANTLFALGAVILVLGFIFTSIRTVSPGHVGVVSVFGKVQERTLDEGLHFINPLASVERMTTQVQMTEADFGGATLDMQNVKVRMAINFRLRSEKASEVYQKIGTDFLNVIVYPAAQEVLKAETAKHKASDILTKRQQIKLDVQNGLSGWLTKYGIELKEISISNVGFDEDYAKAIEQKQVQEQKAEQKEYELLQAQREAQIAQAKAKGEGDAAREAAKAKADALRIEGEAQAEYNRKVAESLTSTLIQADYIKRWDGKLPVYSLGGQSGGVMFTTPLERR